MFKILSQIHIVILAVGLVAGATYLIVQQSTNSFASLTTDRPAINDLGNGTGLHNGQGLGGGPRGDEMVGDSSQSWLDVAKNVSIVAVVTVLLALVKLVFTKKQKDLAQPDDVSSSLLKEKSLTTGIFPLNFHEPSFFVFA
jgi:hypothetical protein